MKLHIYKETGGRLPVKRLEKMFDKLSAEEKKPGWQGNVNLVIIDDDRMRELNKRFRKIDKTTDVLSFNIDTPDCEESLLGEVYVSAPTAARQARDNNVTPAEEIVRLSCHGFLHLFGYDHVKKKDAEQMKSLEDYFVEFSGR
ncbi:MAG: rRNA maturation RNase YbeY [Candidatus Zixiibacteriota bacterium]